MRSILQVQKSLITPIMEVTGGKLLLCQHQVEENKYFHLKWCKEGLSSMFKVIQEKNQSQQKDLQPQFGPVSPGLGGATRSNTFHVAGGT